MTGRADLRRPWGAIFSFLAAVRCARMKYFSGSALQASRHEANFDWLDIDRRRGKIPG
jgi:hypothetical protein